MLKPHAAVIVIGLPRMEFFLAPSQHFHSTLAFLPFLVSLLPLEDVERGRSRMARMGSNERFGDEISALSAVGEYTILACSQSILLFIRSYII